MVATDVASRGIGMIKLQTPPPPSPLPCWGLSKHLPVLVLCDIMARCSTLSKHVGET